MPVMKAARAHPPILKKKVVSQKLRELVRGPLEHLNRASSPRCETCQLRYLLVYHIHYNRDYFSLHHVAAHAICEYFGVPGQLARRVVYRAVIHRSAYAHGHDALI